MIIQFTFFCEIQFINEINFFRLFRTPKPAKEKQMEVVLYASNLLHYVCTMQSFARFV